MPPTAAPARQADRSYWAPLVLIVILATLWRVAYFADAPSPLAGVDAREYHAIATTLLRTGEFRPLAHGVPHGEYAVRTPGYPAFLAVVYWFGERWFSSTLALVRPAQLALDLGALLLTFALAYRLVGRKRALVAAFLYALYPGFWWASSAVYSETLSIFLWAGAILFLTIGFETRRARWFFGAGIILGMAALVRPTGQAFALILLIALVWVYGIRERRWVWHFAAFAVAFAAVTAPWAARNSVIMQRPVGLSSYGGLNFFVGNYLPFHGMFCAATYPIVNHITAHTTDEFAADGALWRAGLKNIGRYVLHRPADYVSLLRGKFRTFWSAYQTQAIDSLWGRLGFGGRQLHDALLLLGLVGLLVATFSGRRFAAVFAAIAFTCLVHVATICEEGRYNLVVMPYVIILASAGLGWLSPRLFGREIMELPLIREADLQAFPPGFSN